MATRTPPEVRALTLGPAAPSTRRAVGPIAWCVLEHLAEAAEDRAGETVSHESVRGTAEPLGLAKDTVARALHRLADAGLVVYAPGRSDDGRFAASHYRLTFPSDLFLDLGAATSVAEATRPMRSPRSRQPSTTTQLSLIDPAAAGS